MNANQRRLVFDLLSVFDRFVDGFQVVSIGNFQYVPASSLKTFRPILGQREIRRTVDRDLVIVDKDRSDFPVSIPASDAASYATPSIRSPSEQMQ